MITLVDDFAWQALLVSFLGSFTDLSLLQYGKKSSAARLIDPQQTTLRAGHRCPPDSQYSLSLTLLFTGPQTLENRRVIY